MEIIFLFILIGSLWFIRQIKVILFWLYLWQLKEYHIGRFFDHFRTDKGKKLFLNWLFISKVALLFYALALSFYPKFLPWHFYATWVFVLTAVYFFESVKFFANIILKKTKKPVPTQKTLTLILANLFFTIFFAFSLFKKIDYFYWFSFGLLSFDVLSSFLVSGIVLLFQPFAVLLRNRIIKKAKEKRELVDELRSSSPFANARVFKDLIVVGITGSYGKTSTKEFLATILSEKFRVLKTKKHQNSEVGISQCILNDLKPEHEVFVCEMAAYNKGGIKLLCGIAKPKIGILTGINEQHMATFGSQENIIKTKYELIENLPADGTAFFNAKNRYCQELYQKTQIKKFLYGENATFPGEENILGAVAVAKELGMTDEEIIRATGKIENKLSGIQLKKGANEINIIDATYSANPDGVMAHLEYLKTFPGRKVIIMPCLIELGRASKEVHGRIGKKIAEVCDLAIITTKDRFKEIKDGSTSLPQKAVEVLFLENPKKIFEKIKSFYQSGDIILLESRVPDLLIKQLEVSN